MNTALPASPPPQLVRERCPFCVDGQVVVHDGTPFPGVALCGYCTGGWVLTEVKS